jgi:riboflavin synthase
MFTGIIEEIGKLRSVEGLGDEKRLTVECAKIADGIADGDSICVSGACLTVTNHGGDFFTAHVSAETLSRTTLGALNSGDKVNLERSLAVGERFGGHFVLGHVDCLGTIKGFTKTGEGKEMLVELPEEYSAYVAPKGSIALDGVSLTSIGVTGNQFSVALIPFTLNNTTLGGKKDGDTLNVEVDIIARYLMRFLERGEPSRGINLQKLIEEGF